MTPREKHCEEMKKIAMEIRRTTSQRRKNDLEKQYRRMSHELKIYDAYRREKRRREKGYSNTSTRRALSRPWKRSWSWE